MASYRFSTGPRINSRAKNQPRDSQRSKLYAAERDTRGEHAGRSYKTIDQCQAFADHVTKAAWTKKHMPALALYRRTVQHGGGASYARTDHYTIWLPAWARCDMVILHELAHCFVTSHRYAHHGREFAHAFLRLVRRFIGRDAHAALRQSFRTHRVRCTLRRSAPLAGGQTQKRSGNPDALRRWRESKAMAASAPAPITRPATIVTGDGEL